MRTAARQLLGPYAGEGDHPVVGEVFGTRTAPSPWAWTGAAVADARVRRHARIARSSDGVAEDHALAIAEQVWAVGAEFEVLNLASLPPDVRSRHELVLSAAAHGVHSLGAARRRGLGWVTIRRVDDGFGPADVVAFLELRGASS